MDWLLGIERDKLPDEATFAFELGAAPAGTRGLFVILLFAAAVALVIWVYRRESRGRLTRRMAIFLAATRLLVLGILAFALTEPRLAVGSWQTVEARTAVLLDSSLSMTVQDRYVDESRRQAVAALMGIAPEEVASTSRLAVLNAVLTQTREDRTVLERLAEDNDAYVYTYGSRPRLVAARRAVPEAEPDDEDDGDGDGGADLAVLRVEAEADATNLAAAMRAALDDAGGETIAALVVIGDGRNNAGEDPAAVGEELLAVRGIPVYTVLVGDDAPPKNVRVSEVLAPERVFSSDPILFEVSLEATGFGKLHTSLQLVRTALDGTGELVVATRELDLEEGRAEPISISHPNREVGEFLFTARLPAQDGEITDADNARAVKVEVIDDKTRVLLVAGGPSNEYRFAKELLRREGTVNLSVWLQSADRDFPQEGDTPIKELPFTPEGLAEYDVVLMLDMDPIELSADRIDALRQFVERDGGGLGFVCGEKFALSLLTDPANRELTEMLPIVPDDDVARDYVGFGRHHATAWRYDITPEGLDHPITRFAASTHTNRRIWERIPGVYWHLPVARARPGAKVLARHSNPEAAGNDGPHPLLVTHFYGPGRTLFMATDETYQWRSVAAKQYAKFWVQGVRYLTQGKLLGGKDQVSLVADSERIPLGGAVTLDAQLRGVDREPLELPQVDAEVKGGDGDVRAVTMLPVPGRPGSYSGLYVPWSLGPSRLAIELPGDGEPARGELTVQVTPPEREFDDSRADPALMGALADATGGQLLFPEQAETLSELIESKRRKILRPGDPIELWDTPLMAILLLAFLSVEWVLRKRRNLL